jgi:hypothetical protein
MEFKGTHQKWGYRPQSISKNGFYIETINKNHIGTFIGEVGGGLQDLKEIEANALLISKAPEMLEMLKELVKQNTYRGYEESEDVIEAKKLIKEATQI